MRHGGTLSSQPYNQTTNKLVRDLHSTDVE